MRLNIIAAAVAALCDVPSTAGINLITDEAAFNALGTFGATTTFDGYQAGDVLLPYVVGQVPLDGGLIPGSPSGVYVAAAGDRLVATASPNDIRIFSTMQGTNLIGFTLAAIADAPVGYISVYSTAGTRRFGVPAIAAGMFGFFGFQATGDDSFYAVQPVGAYGVTDIRFGVASPTTAVPEPATWALMILGFGLVGARLRAPRKAQA